MLEKIRPDIFFDSDPQKQHPLPVPHGQKLDFGEGFFEMHNVFWLAEVSFLFLEVGP